MNSKQFVMLVCAGLIVAACSNLDYSSNYRSEVNFDSFRTYSWYDANEYNAKSTTYLNNDILESQIRADVEQELQDKGLRKVASSDADVLVNYSIATEEKMNIDTYNTYSGFAPGWGYAGVHRLHPYHYFGVGYPAPVTSTRTQITHYQQGTFVLDMVNPQSDQLIWRGTAEGKVPADLSPQEQEDAVAEVVAGVLENFPPEAET